jgi:hypothetical protein
LPSAGGARFGGINAEYVVDAAAGQLGEGDFPALAHPSGSLVDIIR